MNASAAPASTNRATFRRVVPLFPPTGSRLRPYFPIGQLLQVPVELRSSLAVISAGRVVESGTHRALLRQDGLYASLYQEQFEGGKIQWRCPDGDILADGTIRHRETQPA